MKISGILLTEISENTFIDEELDLSDKYIDDRESFRLANALKFNTHIKTLNLSTNDITNIGLEALIAAFQNVENLDISTNRITPTATKILSKSKLKTLNISGNSISDEDIKFLNESKTLLELEAQGCKLTSMGIKRLFTNNTLRKLDLSYNQIEKEAFETLPSNTTLKTLIIIQATLNDECLELLAQNKSLKKVVLLRNNIRDIGAQFLAKNNTIEELDLISNYVGDFGVAAFANNTSIKRLDLSSNKITHEGVSFLSTNNSLVYLNLSANNLGDKCIQYLPLIKTLTNICLTHNKISTSGAKIIIDAFIDKFEKFNLRGILAYNHSIDFDLLEKYLSNSQYNRKEPEASIEVQDTKPPAIPKMVLQLRRKKTSPQKTHPGNKRTQKPTKNKTYLKNGDLTSVSHHINGASSTTLIFSPKLKKQKIEHTTELNSPFSSSNNTNGNGTNHQSKKIKAQTH